MILQGSTSLLKKKTQVILFRNLYIEINSRKTQINMRVLLYLINAHLFYQIWLLLNSLLKKHPIWYPTWKSRNKMEWRSQLLALTHKNEMNKEARMSLFSQICKYSAKIYNWIQLIAGFLFTDSYENKEASSKLICSYMTKSTQQSLRICLYTRPAYHNSLFAGILLSLLGRKSTNLQPCKL